ncbi:death-on-curing protein [Trueperella bonasi]|uniref:Death-on-curing protein n=1 Tax=Trueperella bonasi TaxID=312286 RepID=A0ABT9NEL3_9ACTO|nr:type II toxin-antitoxin system death-on-curing family toxin [Trueperella bonasi]MDP9805826.1 death-on-curing protein [Trueperella bonasi]
MIHLSKEQVLKLHSDLISSTGGLEGVRDANLLDSALASPFQNYEGKDIFPSLHQKAARLGFGLISNHPFVDGNKRTGVHVMLVFLALNGIELEYSQKELISQISAIASGQEGYDELLDWIITHQVD